VTEGEQLKSNIHWGDDEMERVFDDCSRLAAQSKECKCSKHNECTQPIGREAMAEARISFCNYGLRPTCLRGQDFTV